MSAAVIAATIGLVGACSSSDAAEGVPAIATESEIAHFLTEWNSALKTGNPDAVAALYAPDVVLVPAVSDAIRTDRAGIVDYFVHFLAGKPSAVVEESVIEMLDADHAIDPGRYRITIQNDGVPEVVEARFAFVYERTDGNWLIVNHHSSAMPES
ncbi:SgcJ/EcaC family oxidoreductase [Rhodococcus marinonascens]|uniref:SgcJ/EcaC family oxidoreductase n=1 Tax=Rhodococcus marinonascens TaxID=38311 RepID=UPI000A5853EE|nr:SgcJ/EcaC family oxidoreductase [Rhodococcus marinonascens]